MDNSVGNSPKNWRIVDGSNGKHERIAGASAGRIGHGQCYGGCAVLIGCRGKPDGAIGSVTIEENTNQREEIRVRAIVWQQRD